MPQKKIPLVKQIAWHQNKLPDDYLDAYFYLERDNWNDQDYYTSFYLHATSLLTGDTRSRLIGYVKILKAGQQKLQVQQISDETFDVLPETFCSMPTSLDYYERLSQISSEYRDKLLLALRDGIIYPEIRESFENEDGFHVSLMRGRTENDEIFTLAPLMLSRQYSQLYDMKLGFSFQTPEMEAPIDFDFDSPTFGWGNDHLPNRIVALIGRNGSGKSTLLNRIARIAYASPLNRNEPVLKTLGEIKPFGLGFIRIILLSYSAFDSFNTPGIFKEEKATIVEEMKNGLGRFVFCGIRDIVSELESLLPQLPADEAGRLRDEDILQDRSKYTRLKPIDVLGTEFIRNLETIRQTREQDLFKVSVSLLREEPSMHNLLGLDILDRDEENNTSFFHSLSTGHKFVIHAITSIIAYSAPRSLLLFDEPETHLHPPILASFMKAIRYILAKKNAFMIVATHSPVVLQETLHRHVFVVRSEGKLMRIQKPEIETFGESVGLLTQLSFGLNSDFTDYHNTLDKIVDFETTFRLNSPEEILSTIERLFEKGLSLQARTYVLSKIYNKGSDVES